MSQEHTRMWKIFLEMHEGLPRQGPGTYACAKRAFGLCRALPDDPAVLDIGCGVGAQTLQLTEFSQGTIRAVDNHGPFIQRLQEAVDARGLSGRVHAEIGDMAKLPYASECFDLIWSEGALYQMGLSRALDLCWRLLRPYGYLAFTDAIWRKANPPTDLKAAFESDYPTMGWTQDVLRVIENQGFILIDHFPLPEEAWWEEFYVPMERRIEALRRQYAGDQEAQTILDQLAQEPRMHRAHSAYYNYEFFVCQRPG